MKLVVFGASGSVGQEFSEYAIRRGYDVLEVHREQGQVPSSQASCVVLPTMSKESLVGMFKTLDTESVIVTCLGARSAKDAGAIDGDLNCCIMDAAEESGVTFARFVLLSGACVETPLIPLQHAKIRAEQRCCRMRIPTSIIRGTCFYKCFDKMILGVLDGKPARVIGRGDYAVFYPMSSEDMGVYMMNHIEDCCETENHVISVGGSTPYTAKSFAEHVWECAHPGVDAKISRLPMWLWKTIMCVSRWVGLERMHAFMELVLHYNTVPMVPQEFIRETPLCEYMNNSFERYNPSYVSNDERGSSSCEPRRPRHLFRC